MYKLKSENYSIVLLAAAYIVVLFLICGIIQKSWIVIAISMLFGALYFWLLKTALRNDKSKENKPSAN